MKLLISLALLCLISCVAAKWCCGDVDTEVKSKIKAVTRSRTIPKTSIMYEKHKSGYKICANNTIAEKDVPKGFGDKPADSTENKKKYDGLWSKIFGSLASGKDASLGKDQYHSYCPVYTTTSRSVTSYTTEYYMSAMFDDESASCPGNKKMCCRGYKQVGDNCVDEKKAGNAADNLDYLRKLGIVG